MPKVYDDALKKLFRADAQDFVSLAQKGLHVESFLPTELDAENIYADGLARCRQEDGQIILAHFEFQRGNDEHMGERVLEYSLRASRLNDYLPVLSCVIYLKKDGPVQPSPFILKLSDEEIIRFRYKVICVWDMTAAELLAMNLPGLLPLLPLAKDGHRREVIDIMIDRMVEAEKTESLWMGYMLATKALPDDTLWLKRRFAMFNDFLQDSPVYQEFMAEAEARANEKAEARVAEANEKAEARVAKAMKEVETEKMQALSRTRQAFGETLVNLVGVRFPELKVLARVCARDINDSDTLSDLLIKVSVAQEMEEVRKILESYLEAVE